MCSDKQCCLFLEIIIYSVLLLVVVFGWVKIDINLSSKLEILSILFAVAVFYAGWRINRYEHNKNQHDLLLTLKYKMGEIKNMINSYKEQPIPFYLIPLPDEQFYYRMLDYKIDGKSTKDLKFSINRIQDKILIINLMMKKLHSAFDSFLISKNIKIDNGQIDKKNVDNFIKQNGIFKYYHHRILSILNDEKDKKGLPYSLNKSECILNERFDIK